MAERRHATHAIRRQAMDEAEARELGLLYECPEELLAMRRAGFTFPPNMSQLLQVSKQFCFRFISSNSLNGWLFLGRVE